MNNTQNQVNEFLAKNALWLALIAAGLIIVAVVLIFLLGKKKGKEEKHAIVASSYYEALGGEENILSHSRTGSRISLVLKDYGCIDKEKLQEAGVDSFIKMSNKLVLVIQGDAEKVEQTLFPSEASE